MTFCVECGAEGPTVDGLCAGDFTMKHALVRFPEYVDVVRCTHCGRLKLDRGWVDVTLEDAMLDLIAAHAERHPKVERVQYTHDLKAEAERIVPVTVKATCRVGQWDLLTSFHTQVRVHDGTCPTCSRQQGKYYVGTVQVRAEGRPLAAEELQRAREFADRPTPGEAEFVSRVEDVRGGLDVLVSTNALAKRLAQDIARALGGTVKSSATLHTQREGKDMYRATYIVRLPGFRVGDIIEWRRRRYRVVGVGDTVRLEGEGTNERLRVRLRELRGARAIRH